MRDAPADSSGAAAAGATSLKRVLGVPMLLFIVVGDILGAGIYLLVGEVAGGVGGLAWLAFAGAFALAGASAASYAILVTRHPGAAGSALYADAVFGRPRLTFAVGAAVALSSLCTGATTIRAFTGDYLNEFVDLPRPLVTLALVTALVAVALRGIELSARVNVGMTLIELGGLLVVVGIGVAALLAGDAAPERVLDGGDGFGAGAFLGAIALAFFAFLGFEDAVHMSDEVTDVRSTFPKVLFGAVAVTSTVYVAVALVAVSVVPVPDLAASDGPLLEVVRRGPGGISPRLFSAVALVAVSNTSLFALVAASRLLFGMASSGHLPAAFGELGRHQTPVVATIAVGAAAAALSLTGAVGDLAGAAVTMLLAVLVLVNTAAVIVRRRDGGLSDPNHFTAPVWVAPLGAATSAVVLTHELVTSSVGDLTRIGVLVVGIGALSAAQSRRDPVDDAPRVAPTPTTASATAQGD